MAMDFPISPSLNQTYTFSSKTWKWDGSVWKQQIQDAASALPAQTTNSGKYLTTDGTTASWGTIVTSAPVSLNSSTISTNQTITNGYNGLSIGPITIGNNNTVTVANNQRWVII